MLIQFNFKNYRSFRDETTLDLSATKASEYNDRVISVGGEKILPVAAIYGANASGKSNVYSAFEYMRTYVLGSLIYGDDARRFEDNLPMPFLFDKETANLESGFEVYFTIPGDVKERVYNYGFCLGRKGVTEEWLNSRAKTAKEYKPIFYRSAEDNELDLEGISSKERNNIEIALDNRVLIVSLGSKLKIEACRLVRDWFARNVVIDFGDNARNLRLSRIIPDGFTESAVQERIIKYFESFDDSIRGFHVEKLHKGEDDKKPGYRVNALHKMIGTSEMVEIPLELESNGTLKMFALYPGLYEILANGGLFFVDELNARLHPLLVRNFILIFLNPEINRSHAQLIFTTHDTWQLSNQLLRRDEIWFTEKDSDGVSSLYSLADFVDEGGNKIRKDESYEKNYLLGKYGAIPVLKAIDILGEN